MTALTRLTLSNFRNYGSMRLELEGKHVCLFGPNGAGKTNLIEAVSQLGPGRGLRSAALTDMNNNTSEANWAISAHLLDDRQIGVGLTRDGRAAKRTVRIDGAPSTPTDLAELIRIVWLTPAMDGVFRGGTSDRRRFFDRHVMAHIPEHGRTASRYEKAMRERNALLERGRVDPAWADAIETRMAEAGAQMAINRSLVLEILQTSINERPEDDFPKADLYLDGGAEMAALGGTDFKTIFDDLNDLFRNMRRKDGAAGRTLAGPHRTDLSVIHRPTGAAAKNASTGQQKALLIGIILASAKALSADGTGPTPLLLLDEAAAHLDEHRRAALFDALEDIGGQAWLTGTEARLFEAFGNRAQRVHVTEGTTSMTN